MTLRGKTTASLTLILLVLLATGPAAADGQKAAAVQQHRTGTVSGHAFALNSGGTIAGLEVRLSDVSDDARVWNGMTDKQGGFLFEDVPFGAYRLSLGEETGNWVQASPDYLVIVDSMNPLNLPLTVVKTKKGPAAAATAGGTGAKALTSKPMIVVYAATGSLLAYSQFKDQDPIREYASPYIP